MRRVNEETDDCQCLHCKVNRMIVEEEKESNRKVTEADQVLSVKRAEEDVPESSGADEIVIVIKKDALTRGDLKIRVYGHDSNEDSLCMLCKWRENCHQNADGLIKTCFVPCG